jgi:hypothetical protein
MECCRLLKRKEIGGVSFGFDGVSFQGLSEGIQSMLDLEAWKVSYVSLVDMVPKPLFMIVSLFPVASMSLHLSTQRYFIPSRIVVDGIKKLVAKIDSEDWGVELASFDNLEGIWT